jgi:NDP-sugar pyrophosphorylase family protein
VVHAQHGVRRAIVLAAGLGSRLGAHTAEVPKCLVDVNGIPILANALEHLEAAGIEETTVVVGYRAEAVRRRFGHALQRMRLSYCLNAAFRTTNTCRSLKLALDSIDDAVLVLEGDVFFERRVLEDVLAISTPDATVVARWTPAIDGSVVDIDSTGWIRAWMHKKDRPSGFVPAGLYKTVNLHRFSRAFVTGRLRPALASERITRGGREPIETALAAIVGEGGRIRAVEATGQWIEIDDEMDLRAAEALFEGANYGPR